MQQQQQQQKKRPKLNVCIWFLCSFLSDFLLLYFFSSLLRFGHVCNASCTVSFHLFAEQFVFWFLLCRFHLSSDFLYLIYASVAWIAITNGVCVYTDSYCVTHIAANFKKWTLHPYIQSTNHGWKKIKKNSDSFVSSTEMVSTIPKRRPKGEKKK